MSKFREVLAQRRKEIATQWQLFCSVFQTEVVRPGMSAEQVDMLRTVMWSAWRSCAYTNGIITDPRNTSGERDG